jgi:hypothetical protein
LQRQQDDCPKVGVKPNDQLKGDLEGGGNVTHAQKMDLRDGCERGFASSQYHASGTAPKWHRHVTSTCDPAVGEVATVYQAAGFDYVGRMYGGTRTLIVQQGRIISERHAKRRFGTCGQRALATLGIRSDCVPHRSC